MADDIKNVPTKLIRLEKRQMDGTEFGTKRIGVKQFRPSCMLVDENDNPIMRTLVINTERFGGGHILSVGGAPVALMTKEKRLRLFDVTNVNLSEHVLTKRITSFCHSYDLEPLDVLDINAPFISPFQTFNASPDMWLLTNAMKYKRAEILPLGSFMTHVFDRLLRQWNCNRLKEPVTKRPVTVEWANRMVTYLASCKNKDMMELLNLIWLPWMETYKLFLNGDNWIAISSRYETSKMIEQAIPDVKTRDTWLLDHTALSDLLNRLGTLTGQFPPVPKLYTGGSETEYHQKVRMQALQSLSKDVSLDDLI